MSNEQSSNQELAQEVADLLRVKPPGQTQIIKTDHFHINIEVNGKIDVQHLRQAIANLEDILKAFKPGIS